MVCALILSATTASADFSISFKWGDIPLCTSGKPNRVGNPQFVLKGVPQGTKVIEFRLKDLDVPSYNHGGGKVKVSGDGRMPAGIFKYKSPCPPSGAHTYEWTATAKNGRQVLGTATARRRYPE
ncbi:phospholipid-binding protein [Thalassococcus sp. S3]|nr:phospholipid-binding protein [Thalassococcus sp. S3]